MICNVARSTLSGSVRCPSSKSYTHRAVFLASLADGTSTIRNPLFSADTEATIAACKKFGADIENDGEVLKVTGVRNVMPAEIDAANSGTTMRIAAAVAALADGASTLRGDESLSRRPMGSLLKALYVLGARVDSDDGTPPVTVGGPIDGGRVEITGDVSSQYVSALLIAGAASKNGIIVDIDGPLVSKDYVGYTLEAMRAFGAAVEAKDAEYSCVGQKYSATDFAVPHDMSILALLAAASVLVGDKLDICTGRMADGAPSESLNVSRICKEAGAEISYDQDRCVIECETGSGDRTVDLTDQPDLLPAIALFALKNPGRTIINGIGHTRYKETDRISVIYEELSKAGVTMERTENSITVEPCAKLVPADFDSRGDHRLFMAFCIAGMYIGDCTVTDAESVAVSYPNFVRDMNSVGGKIGLSCKI